MGLGEIIEVRVRCEPVPRSGELGRTIRRTPALKEHDHRRPAAGDWLTALPAGSWLTTCGVDDEVLIAKPIPEVPHVPAALEDGTEAPWLQHPQDLLVNRLEPAPVAGGV